MARPRFKKLDKDKQETILEAAAIEFAAHGFESASFNQIIERAGISKGAAYYYFDDKADLYTTVLENALGKMAKWIGGRSIEDFEGPRFWDQLEDYLVSSFQFLRQKPWLFRLLQSQYTPGKVPSGQRRDSLLFNAARKYTQGLLQHGQKEGVIRTDLPFELLTEVTMSLSEAMDRWVIDHLDKMSDDDLGETSEMLVEIVRRVLEVEPGHRTSSKAQDNLES